MKFQFCGNLSCPEWFLAESAILSKITSIKIKLLLGSMVMQFLEDIDNTQKILQLLSNTFNEEEINSILSSLEFILSNSIRFDVEDSILLKELIDLGLPKENCESIAKVFKENKEKLKSKKAKITPRINRLETFNYSINKLINTNKVSHIPENISKFAYIKLKTSENALNKIANKSIDFVICKEKLLELISELEKANDLMNKF